MSVSAIQNSGICPSPEVQRAQPVPAAPPAEDPVKGDRVVPEERAFDRYEPEGKSEVTVCDTGAVDRELESLRKEREQLEQQLRTAAPEQAEAIRQQLDQVTRELAQKDNDAYRRQHAVFS